MSVIAQVRALPLNRRGSATSPLMNIQIATSTMTRLKCAAAENRVAMGRLAELAIERLLTDITAEVSRSPETNQAA